MSPGLYGLELIMDRLRLAILDRATEMEPHPADERVLGVYLNAQYKGDISLLPFHRPACTVVLPTILIWGGRRVFWLDIEQGNVAQRLEHLDEIQAVYPMKSGWCVVGEISLAIFDAGFATKTCEFQLDEVVIESWWEGHKLRLRDLQERLLAFQEVDSGDRLEPVSSF